MRNRVGDPELDALLRRLGLDAEALARDAAGARLCTELLERASPRPQARYVVVTGSARAVDPGVAATALAGALQAAGERAIVTRRGGAGRGLPGGDDARSLRIVRAMLVEAAAGRAVRPLAGDLASARALALDGDDWRRRAARAAVAQDAAGEALSAARLGLPPLQEQRLHGLLRPWLCALDAGLPALVDFAAPMRAFGGTGVVTDRIALRCADWVVTEAPAGIEPFVQLKCRAAALRPQVGVHVHAPADGRRPLECAIGALRLHGVQPVVVVAGPGPDRDTREAAAQAGVVIVTAAACSASGFAAVAQALRRAAEGAQGFRYLYPLDAALDEKLACVATRHAGAEQLIVSPALRDAIARLDAGAGRGLPLRLSLPRTPGARRRLRLRDVTLWPGGGFVRARAVAVDDTIR